MSKKLYLILAGAVASAIVLCLPATASATRLCETESNDQTCTNIGVGTVIRGHLVGNSTMTDAAGGTLLTCTVGELTGTLTKNSGGTVEADIENAHFTGTGANGECTGTFGGTWVDTNLGNGTPWCLKASNSDIFSIRGNLCTREARSITFVLTSTTAGTCKYNRTAAAEGTLTTDNLAGTSEDAQATLSTVEWFKEEGGILCPSLGRMDMTFTLETDVAGTAPLYFKEG